MEKLLIDKTPNLRVLNCNVNMAPTDPDPIIQHHQGHIPTASFLDLRYLRDVKSQYPHMMPEEKLF